MIKLYPHQREVLSRLRNGSILWADTGVGKSITALAYFLEIECDHLKKPKNLLIITTARKRDSNEWLGECVKVGLSTNQELSENRIRVVIDSWNNLHKYVETNGWFIIFDEQRVTGFGPWAKAFIRMAKHNHWILLSATPGDRWMEYCTVFVANGYYRTMTEFKREHVIYSPFISKYPKIIGYQGIDRLCRQRNEILVGMHFDKQTVQHHKDISVDYDHDLYGTALKKRWNPFKDEPIRDAGGLCNVLRRCCNGEARRLAEVIRLMRTHPKCIIFYNFDYELEQLELLPCTIAEWNGHRHHDIPDTDRWAYLVQYNAGAEGWNCISTNTIIFYSRSYSYKAMMQAAGRIDRINTGYHDLYYYYLKTDSGIDRAIDRALSEKRDFNESAFYDSLEKQISE